MRLQENIDTLKCHDVSFHDAVTDFLQIFLITSYQPAQGSLAWVHTPGWGNAVQCLKN